MEFGVYQAYQHTSDEAYDRSYNNGGEYPYDGYPDIW